jgi:hypothetical protein
MPLVIQNAAEPAPLPRPKRSSLFEPLAQACEANRHERRTHPCAAGARDGVYVDLPLVLLLARLKVLDVRADQTARVGDLKHRVGAIRVAVLPVTTIAEMIVAKVDGATGRAVHARERLGQHFCSDWIGPVAWKLGLVGGFQHVQSSHVFRRHGRLSPRFGDEARLPPLLRPRRGNNLSH